ncbi:phage holin family protein [Marivita sp.]|uniref:phage holin family protein n=1 Tax=Marivita sp. TaxID=2003365 RepID=UPI0025C2B028|nr:phage holin family protein [Marivita sp.]
MTQPTDQSTDWRRLIGDTIDEARALVRAEIQLAKQELSENAARAGGGVVLFVIAALLGFAGFNALAVAAVLGVMALGVASHWAALIVAAGFLVVALVFLLIGKSRLSAKGLTPNRTINQIKSDVNAVKEMTRA